MKKNMLLLAATMTLATTVTLACGSPADKPERAEKTDTVAEMATVEATEEVTVGKGDLAMWELTGNVRSCTWKKRFQTNTYGFNQAGKWTHFDNKALSASFTNIKRNAKGKIVSYEGGEYDGAYTEKYTYDATGRVIKYEMECADGSRTYITYTYDEKGRVKSYTDVSEVWEMDAEEPDRSTTTCTYTYLQTDAKGNWTKRKGDDGGESWIETRTIRYY